MAAGNIRAEGERSVRLLLQYDGSPYHGWQVQPGLVTIQGLLQEAATRITGEPAAMRGAGRTDAGVHALGQVAHFRTLSPLPCHDLCRALNALLPRSIAVLDAQDAPPSFDSRYSALAKTYRYRMLLRRCRSPLEEGRLWHIPYPLRIAPMRQAAAALTGRLDFSSFRAAGCASRTAVRNLTDIRLRRSGDHLTIDFTGEGFLRHMVRALVGTLVETGRGRFHPDDMQHILQARDRSRAGLTAPPQGLCLMAVHYPPEITWSHQAPPPPGLKKKPPS